MAAKDNAAQRTWSIEDRQRIVDEVLATTIGYSNHILGSPPDN